MPFLSPNQQCQSTEEKMRKKKNKNKKEFYCAMSPKKRQTHN